MTSDMTATFCTAVALALVATSASLPVSRTAILRDFNTIDLGESASVVNPFPGREEDIAAWMAAIGSLVAPPEDPVRDKPGPTIYDDFGVPSREHIKTSLARTLWFEEFPHDRAMLSWQSKRQKQGLPLYQLSSQRPGFPFYSGN